ncbi:MAG: hypothetical protein JWS10_1102 [Cypionkella sp.]|uniref:lipocalin-like domain-containing protein n=1 Tax=Cypionkella sp. TaxID=2811411 RepID=UPI0026315DB0|nr:lipocalin-like domain-containing protein [Cypionkella sp.]MDB5658487.1 hypothetical protein [Cypionkella sp.]
MTPEDLFGTWTLISHQFVTLETDERREMFGADPLGTLVLTPDHRMIAFITANDRKPAVDDASTAALYKSMLVYSGPFRLEAPDQLVTTVEMAWHPAWVGGEQARTLALEGDILSIMTPVMAHPTIAGQTARGVLTWRRLSRF